MKKFSPLLLLVIGLLLGAAGTQVTHLDHRIVDLVGSQLKFDSQSSLTNEDGLWGISAIQLQEIANQSWINNNGVIATIGSTNRVQWVFSGTNDTTKILFGDGGKFPFQVQVSTTTSNDIAIGESAAVYGAGNSGLSLNYGVIGASAPIYVSGGTNIGVAGVALPYGSDGVYVGGFFSVSPDDAANPIYEPAVILADSFTSNTIPLIVGRTNNGTTVFKVASTGRTTATGFAVSGTTNQVIFGSTNTAPSGAATPTKWISVQVTGESVVYRLPLYQ